MSRKDWGFSRKRSSVKRTRVWVELWSLAYNVASDTHEVVKHDNITSVESGFLVDGSSGASSEEGLALGAVGCGRGSVMVTLV